MGRGSHSWSAAILATLRYRDAPTTARLVTAAGLAGLASLIKPTVAFALVGGFLCLAVEKDGIRRALLSSTTWSYLAITVLPAGGFYGYGVAFGGALRSSVGTSFLPRLWFEASYWRGWLNIVHVVIGGGFAIVALAAPVLARRPEARALMAGLLSGYVVFGLAFTYHIHTHDYYSLQLIPIVGLGVGLIVDVGVLHLRRMEVAPVMKGAVVLTAVGLCAAVASSAVRVALPRPAKAVRAGIEQAELIGDLVSHSTRAITMAVAYGSPLQYHGEFAGPSWPNSGDMRLAALQGQERSSSRQLLDSLARAGNEWFVITDFDELVRQPEVRALLDDHARLAAEGDGYAIYDLREYQGRPSPMPAR